MITVPQNKSDLRNLIENKIEENISLEYKAADALQITDPKKKEIAKDVSAMANAAGGIIIYGIKEFDEPDKKHLPEKITPLVRTTISKEWLEQVIDSNISPKIQGLLIHPIQIDSSTEVVYAVEIPQGTTAHQNTSDFKYYRRHNFKSEPMLDYEIKDLMNRLKNPIISLLFSIDKYKERITIGNLMNLPPESKTIVSKELIIKLSNDSSVYAKYINYFVYLPADIVDIFIAKDLKIDDDGRLIFKGDNQLNGRCVILPGVSWDVANIKLSHDADLDEREMSWYVHADNAEPKYGKIKLNEIPQLWKNGY